MNKNQPQIQRNLWENPWGYVESFFIGIGLIVTGFFLEVFVASDTAFTMSYPFNIYFLVGYISLMEVSSLFENCDKLGVKIPEKIKEKINNERSDI